MKQTNECNKTETEQTSGYQLGEEGVEGHSFELRVKCHWAIWENIDDWDHQTRNFWKVFNKEHGESGMNVETSINMHYQV